MKNMPIMQFTLNSFNLEHTKNGLIQVENADFCFMTRKLKMMFLIEIVTII